MTVELNGTLVTKPPNKSSSAYVQLQAGSIVITYDLVDVDEHTGFGVLRGQNVAVDGDSPALVTAQLRVSIQAVYKRRKLGAQEENVDAAERGDVVEGVGDRSLERSGCEVSDHLAIDIDSGTPLHIVSKDIRVAQNNE